MSSVNENHFYYILFIYHFLENFFTRKKLSKNDSLFILSNGNLSNEYIKIQYVGDQNHFVPAIYFENSEVCNTGLGKCSCSAGYTFHVGLYAYTFRFDDRSYANINETIVKNWKQTFDDSTMGEYRSFQICIKSVNHVDTLYTRTFQFFDNLKSNLIDLKSACYLWIIPAINDMDYYTRPIIKPD